MAGVEHRAPARFAAIEVVREEIRRRLSDEVREWNPLIPR